ncbi:MAG: GNAT family N-acetyltransferase [Clostridia bacterium]|nr:GNAT family N-acetyltransferase [Clostridia bacterium]
MGESSMDLTDIDYLGIDRVLREHLEGSMGLLYIFPEFRRRGYATELEKAVIAKTLQEGYTPFCQIEKSNSASMALQRKLGLAISDRLICWMWK